jgi:hypothetical protein
MFNQITALLKPPIFADEDQTRSAALLNTILITFDALLVMLVAALSALGVANPRNVTIALVVIGLVLGLWALMRRGHVRLATGLFCGLVLAATTLAIFNLGTIRTLLVLMYLIGILLSTLLIGPRTGLAMLALSAAALWGLFLAETAGWLPVVPPPAAWSWSFTCS